MEQVKSVSICGCGWLGLPLGKYLVEKGFSVKGSTTRKEKFNELREAGIQPFHISLDPELSGDDPVSFFQSDVLVINVPPKRRPDIVYYHQQQMASLKEAVKTSPIRHVVFISSTSVYPSLNRDVKEEDAVNPEFSSGEALLGVEKVLLEESSFRTTVLRFCGLMGYDRSPVKFLGRMATVINANQPANLIHRDDCISIIYEVIRQGVWGEVFNACSPGHPLRREYYAGAAELSGLDLPPLEGEKGDAPFKIIDSSRLEKVLGYRFQVPDPLDLPEDPEDIKS
ncbi:SDR family oxidoreductase [Prosthecochloris sp. SCSIO W1102]|uniref:SDR family oxidoreductase n=1 Tax=Prosthecochloris sp. SCSIO W1102 TaxID=2992243 RepID=UPI00223CBA88|nr:SDR family oxidoreductase [Prosthecochloris sp. SCSIO W1102]UZJ39143.1 SDR family oxidoreductase [Prosthecochloris sp. SCSIO W1102]